MVILPKSIVLSRIKSNIDEPLRIALSLGDLQTLDELDKGPEHGRFNHPITPWLGRGPFSDDTKLYKNFKKFDGIIAAALTPLNPDGLSVNFSLIEPYANLLAQNGVNGVLVSGTTGES